MVGLASAPLRQLLTVRQRVAIRAVPNVPIAHITPINRFEVTPYDTHLQQGLRAGQASEGHVPIKRLHL